MSRPVITENLQTAIHRLRPELPALLGADYTPFVAQLDALLAGGSGNQVLDLCGKYPVVDERLGHILDQQEEEDIIRGGRGLTGDPIHPIDNDYPLLQYRCEMGLHVVVAKHVERLDAAGNALCPQHGVPMIIVKKGNEPNQKRM